MADTVGNSIRAAKQYLNPNDPTKEERAKMYNELNKANMKGDGPIVGNQNKAKKNAYIDGMAEGNNAPKEMVHTPDNKRSEGRFWNDVEQTNNAGKEVGGKNSHFMDMKAKPLGKLPGIAGGVADVIGTAIELQKIKNRGGGWLKQAKPIAEDT
jgi:hypothetical protein